MEKIKCIVLDDDLAYCERIASYITKHERLELAGKFTDTDDARNFLEDHKAPLIFIDVEMPGINGIDFINALSYQPYTIIVSGYPDFAIKAYDVEVNDFVVKPFNKERFYYAVNRAIEHFEIKDKARVLDQMSIPFAHAGTDGIAPDDYFFVRSEQNYLRLWYSSVLYIEALDDFARIYLKDKDKPVITLVNLKQLENKLSPHVFIRIHKSYLVNMNHISALSGDFITVAGNEIPLGPSYKEGITKKIISNKLIRR